MISVKLPITPVNIGFLLQLINYLGRVNLVEHFYTIQNKHILEKMENKEFTHFLIKGLHTVLTKFGHVVLLILLFCTS